MVCRNCGAWDSLPLLTLSDNELAKALLHGCPRCGTPYLRENMHETCMKRV